jgi:predicted alpha/beta hydrolase family esterase
VYTKFLLSKKWNYSDNLIVGHSSGSKAILAILQALPTTVNIGTAVLVGTFLGDLGWDTLHGVNAKFDYEHIKQKAKHFVVVHGADDPFCPVAGAKEIAALLGAEWHLLPTGQHFSIKLDPKYAEFPELLHIMEPYL